MNIKKAVVFSLMLAASAANAGSNDNLHIGSITSSDLLTQYDDFNEEYLNFSLVEADVKKLNSIGDNIEVKVYFGTWCHDSEREVPRFIKLLSQIQTIKASFYALDKNKSDPQGLAKKSNIKYTPTFVVYRAGKEIGRIIERPEKSIAKDILAML